jgi:ribosome-associated toxin RatA of RatAB toxin-antitoxin module
MRKWFAFVFYIIFLCCAQAESNKEKSIEKGDIITNIIKEGEQREVRAELIIDAPVKLVWDMINDYDHQTEYMPQVIESAVLKSETNKKWVRIKIRILFFKMIITTVHTFGGKNFYYHWDLVEGPFEVNRGSWLLEPYDNNRTKVNYRVVVVHKLMHDWIMADLVKKSLTEMFDTFRKRADYLKKQGEIKIQKSN